jgi:hypothetical protein
VLTAVGGVVVAIVLVGVVLNLTTDPDVDVNLGAEVFEVGKAEPFAEEINDNGPLLFQALVGGRDIYVQHLGAKPTQGWLAFLAYPDDRRDCQLRWIQREQRFLDCDRRAYPPDGEGLTHFPASVNRDGAVVVDLRSEVVSP